MLDRNFFACSDLFVAEVDKDVLVCPSEKFGLDFNHLFFKRLDSLFDFTAFGNFAADRNAIGDSDIRRILKASCIGQLKNTSANVFCSDRAVTDLHFECAA